MKNLLLIFSVLLSTSLSASLIEEVLSKNLGYTPGIVVAGSDGSFVTFQNGATNLQRWYGNDGSFIRGFDFSGSSSRPLSFNSNLLIIHNENGGDGGTWIPSIVVADSSGQTSEQSYYGNYFEVNAQNPQTINNGYFATFNNQTVYVYKIANYSQASSSNSSLSTIPSNAVVIPSDSSGPVQIILESSEDMVNWNSANPGSYGASTNERFFRIRAVQDTE